MKKRIIFTPLFAGVGLFAFGSAALHGQNIIFQDHFNYAPGSGPSELTNEGPWGVASIASGTMEVMEDTGNVFGYGSTNRFLRIDDGLDFQLRTPAFAGADTVTLSLDFIDQRLSSEALGQVNAERLTNQFFASLDNGITNDDRAHLFSLQNGNEIRSSAGTYPDQTRIRFDVIVNNDPSTITYDRPDGAGTKDLATGESDVWIADQMDGNFIPGNYTLAAQDYNFARGSDGDGPIEMVTFQTFSNDGFSVDLDNFTVYEGAAPGEVIPEPSTYALLFGLGVLGTALVIRRRRS